MGRGPSLSEGKGFLGGDPPLPTLEPLHRGRGSAFPPAKNAADLRKKNVEHPRPEPTPGSLDWAHKNQIQTKQEWLRKLSLQYQEGQASIQPLRLPWPPYVYDFLHLLPGSMVIVDDGTFGDEWDFQDALDGVGIFAHGPKQSSGNYASESTRRALRAMRQSIIPTTPEL